MKAKKAKVTTKEYQGGMGNKSENVTAKQRKKGKQDTLKNNTYHAQQDLNKWEYLAKNRRYKDPSLEVP